ncbi:MAG: hypothetical protein ACXVB4_10370 [Pseudobdellovibrionaceae bacterium]
MKDFASFLESGQSQLDPSVLEKIKKEIFPRPSAVALKMGLIHLLSSVFTLMACPQFGLRLFFSGHGLMHYFMKAGSLACFAFCGAFYLGATFWAAKIFLGEFEWEVLRKNPALSLGGVALLSLGVFSMISHDLNFEAVFVWLLGACLSGAIPLLTRVQHRPLIKSF